MVDHPNTFKIPKILDSPENKNVTSAPVCVYYQIKIKNFAQVAAPINLLPRKMIVFV